LGLLAAWAHSWTVSDDLDDHIADRAARLIEAMAYLAQQGHAGRSRPAAVGRAEDRAQVAQAGGRQERVADRVGGHVSVGVALKAVALVRPVEARESERAARTERVDVDSDAHPWNKRCQFA
jgi:hypothetical protein